MPGLHGREQTVPRAAGCPIAPIRAGEAVYLREGEDHEMKSQAGLTALIIEGESLDRFRGRPASTEALS